MHSLKRSNEKRTQTSKGVIKCQYGIDLGIMCKVELIRHPKIKKVENND